MNADTRVCGVALFRSDGSALLQHRDDKLGISDPGLWVFPGGHVEPGETPEAGARREFQEETCYCCAELHLFVSCSARDLGYEEDLLFSFFWERFDGRQEIKCCEGQETRFVKRSEMERLPTPSYVPRLWDLALAAGAWVPDEWVIVPRA